MTPSWRVDTKEQVFAADGTDELDTELTTGILASQLMKKAPNTLVLID